MPPDETPGDETSPPGGPEAPSHQAGTAWSLTWLGHATAAAEIDGRRVLIDPLGRGRGRAAGRVDAILITHSHVDHLNRWTLRGLDRDTHLIVPRGAGRIVTDLGFRELTEVEPGDQLDVAGLDISAVSTAHDTGRWRKGDDPLCAGYVIARGGVAVHHAGDVDFADHRVFDDLGKQFALDATLLPIGGMLPVWYYRWRRNAPDRGVHIDPDAALEIAERLGARTMVPIHWGTVNLRLGPSSMPRRRLIKIASDRGLDKLVRVLGHGESLGSGSGQVVVKDAAQAEAGDHQPHQAAEDLVANRRI